MRSAVAKNFETSKKVEGLLNRLANYMAGDIPDTEDLNDLFGKKKLVGNPNATDTDLDDATTVQSRKELPKLNPISLEPIYAPPEEPTSLRRNNFEVEPLPEDADQKSLGLILEEDDKEPYLPEIYD